MSIFTRHRERSETTQGSWIDPINNGSYITRPRWAWVPAGSTWRYAIIAWDTTGPDLEDIPTLTKSSFIDDVDVGGRQVLKPVSHTKIDCAPYPEVDFILRNQICYEDMTGTGNGPWDYRPDYRLRSHRIHSELVGWAHEQGFVNITTRQWTPPSDIVPPSRKGELPGRVVRRIEELGTIQNLYEMKDMPELAGMFRTRGCLSEALRAFSTMCKAQRLGARNLKWFLEAMRSSYLGKQFGIDPTVSLVRDICRLSQKGLKERKKVFNVTLKGQKQDSRVIATGWTSDNVAYVRAVGQQHAVVDRVDGVRVTDVRPSYGALSDQMQQYIDALIGVNGARLFWDVAPFGFVADWFLSIDDVLDTLWANSTHAYKLEYWSSVRAELTQVYEGTYAKDVLGCWPNPEFVIRPLPDYKQSQTIYDRRVEEQPSPLESLRCRIGGQTAFLTLLLALGYVPTRKRRK